MAQIQIFKLVLVDPLDWANDVNSVLLDFQPG